MEPSELSSKSNRFSWKTILLLAGFILPLLLLGTVAATDRLSSPILGNNPYPLYPKVNYGTGPQAELIKRGEYLAIAGDCVACHTDTQHHGIPFAGGLGIKTRFGTFYTPNITPDKETGIGNWSDENFLRAMRQGIRPDGSYYYPVFPLHLFRENTQR